MAPTGGLPDRDEVMAPPARPPRDRRVVGIVGLIVVGLLALSVISAFVPGMDGALAALPIVVGILVVGTALVLARSLRGGAG